MGRSARLLCGGIPWTDVKNKVKTDEKIKVKRQMGRTEPRIDGKFKSQGMDGKYRVKRNW
jgi:hypothetical protein